MQQTVILSSLCKWKCPKWLFFVVKRYAVREAKIGRYAVRKGKVGVTLCYVFEVIQPRLLRVNNYFIYWNKKV